MRKHLTPSWAGSRSLVVATWTMTAMRASLLVNRWPWRLRMLSSIALAAGKRYALNHAVQARRLGNVY
jgi:hypothetical protein